MNTHFVQRPQALLLSNKAISRCLIGEVTTAILPVSMPIKGSIMDNVMEYTGKKPFKLSVSYNELISGLPTIEQAREKRKPKKRTAKTNGR